MADSELEKEFQFFVEHQNELVRQYGGQYVVIKGQRVIGTYPSEMKAIEETTKTHALGTFLVQKCDPGEETYTQVYHSRVIFA